MAACDDLAAFIREHFRSVWVLELLLILKGECRSAWSVDALVAEMRANAPMVRRGLDALQRSGFILEQAPDEFRYQPASRLLGRLCDEVEAAYRERPVLVINVIAAPPDRLQALADAFRIKRDRS